MHNGITTDLLTALKITKNLSNLLSDENPKLRKQLDIDDKKYGG